MHGLQKHLVGFTLLLRAGHRHQVVLHRLPHFPQLLGLRGHHLGQLLDLRLVLRLVLREGVGVGQRLVLLQRQALRLQLLLLRLHHLSEVGESLHRGVHRTSELFLKLLHHLDHFVQPLHLLGGHVALLPGLLQRVHEALRLNLVGGQLLVGLRQRLLQRLHLALLVRRQRARLCLHQRCFLSGCVRELLLKHFLQFCAGCLSVSARLCFDSRECLSISATGRQR
mmetsp:Transcript_32189/g.70238  ORF Transcript_32189/g.70238 Transcript_32189/m.70238 type:complete len:225 (+) Transcript_32189:469-1143(+)